MLTAKAQEHQAQNSTNLPVVNQDVIEMLRAGISPAVVLTKIKTTTCRFDTSPSALVSLKEAGVPDELLMEMVRNPQGLLPPVEAAHTPELQPAPQPEQRRPFDDGLPEYGDISELRRMHRVFVIADDIDSENMLIRGLQTYDGLQVVGSPDKAEIFVAFTQGSEATRMQFGGLFSGTIDYRTKAQFIVFYQSEGGRKRIVWRETEDIQTSSGFSFSRPNELNVIRHFIKALRSTRGE
jgi:hypothetical protein